MSLDGKWAHELVHEIPVEERKFGISWLVTHRRDIMFCLLKKESVNLTVAIKKELKIMANRQETLSFNVDHYFLPPEHDPQEDYK